MINFFSCSISSDYPNWLVIMVKTYIKFVQKLLNINVNIFKEIRETQSLWIIIIISTPISNPIIWKKKYKVLFFISVSSFIHFSFLNLKFPIRLIGLFWPTLAYGYASLFVIHPAFVKHDFYFYFSRCCAACSLCVTQSSVALTGQETPGNSGIEWKTTNGGGEVPINVLQAKS